MSATGFLWLFGPATVGMAFGSWLSGRFAGRLTTARTLALAYGLMGVAAAGNALLPFLHPPGLPWSVVPLFFYVLGMSLAFPTLTLLALDLFPARRGLAASCQTFIHTAIAAGNAVLAPFVWASVGTLAATQLAALSLGVGALGLFVWLGARPAPEIAGLVPPQG